MILFKDSHESQTVRDFAIYVCSTVVYTSVTWCDRICTFSVTVFAPPHHRDRICKNRHKNVAYFGIFFADWRACPLTERTVSIRVLYLQRV